jgi:hypothetical protein
MPAAPQDSRSCPADRRPTRALAPGSLSPAWQERVTAQDFWAGAFPTPATAEPVLLALAAGVIAQAAWVSLRAAFPRGRVSQLPLTQAAAVTAMAAVITALAVRAIG